LLPSRGDIRDTTISAHKVKGVGLRNSIPLLRITTESLDNSSLAWRAATVTGAENGALPTNFLALIIISKIPREASASNGKTMKAQRKGQKTGKIGTYLGTNRGDAGGWRERLSQKTWICLPGRSAGEE
jgi:hypothetical protein